MRLPIIAAALVALSTPAVADYTLEIINTGLTDYYCSITVKLTNRSDKKLTEINGYFISFVGDQDVGRSRGASFLHVAAHQSDEAEFLTPNAPCDDVTRYRFVVGACRFETSFADRTACAPLIIPVAPIMEAVAR